MESAALSQIIERVRESAHAGSPLRISGGGTKDFVGGPAVALSRAERLDMRGHVGVVEYEPSELVVTVRAGTPLAELEAELASRGQCLAFEPPRLAAGGTVGGMVAAGLSGPSRASVGAVRDYVLGIEIINGKGELLRFGGQVMKNVAGYDVSRLMAGSWGTLGAITEVSLKVLPVAPAEATLRFECDEATALQRLHAWGGQPLPLNASCWTSFRGVGLLFVRLRGAKAAVESACANMGGERLDNLLINAVWDKLRDQSVPWFEGRTNRPDCALWRLSVPQTAPVLQLPLPPSEESTLIEWHGGLRWVQAPIEAASALHAAAQAVGGSATLYAAPAQGLTLESTAPAHQQAALAAITKRLKQSFDPSGIFQPVRMGAGG